MLARAFYTSLRRRADFSRVHVQGRRKGDALMQVRVLPRPSSASMEPPIRLGLIVSKKFGSAVERNRFKRIIRAAIRNLASEIIAPFDLLVLPRDTAHGAKMQDALSSLRGLLGDLGVITKVPSSADEGDS